MQKSKLLLEVVIHSIKRRLLATDSNKKLPAGRVAVVGSGPAAFYCVQSLFRRWDTCTVDMYEKLPVPYGLVRFGVAPDHPEVKNCINQFDKCVTDAHNRFKFFGNVEIGKDVLVGDLMRAYHVVVLAYGAESENRLGVPGDDARNCLSARSFVGWYNGHPDMKNLNVDLEHVSNDTAVVFGQGNVALDVARILLLPIDQLAKTDITEAALESLKKSAIRRVVLVGRRGPLQVAFTIAELREMTKLPCSLACLDKSDFEKIDAKVIESLERPRRRLTQLMVDTSLKERREDPKQKMWTLKFLRSPFEVLTTNGRTSGVKLVINQLDSASVANPTNQFENIDCGLILYSIGYRSLNVEPSTLPFNVKRCILEMDENNPSRVRGLSGVYACGWCAKGPVGVLALTQNHGKSVAESVVTDVANGTIDVSIAKGGASWIEPMLIDKNVPWISWDNWKHIDELEQNCGKFSDKPRRKIVDKKEFFKYSSNLKV